MSGLANKPELLKSGLLRIEERDTIYSIHGALNLPNGLQYVPVPQEGDKHMYRAMGDGWRVDIETKSSEKGSFSLKVGKKTDVVGQPNQITMTGIIVENKILLIPHFPSHVFLMGARSGQNPVITLDASESLSKGLQTIDFESLTIPEVLEGIDNLNAAELLLKLARNMLEG